MKTKLLLLFLFALFENTQAQTRFITKVLDAYPVKLIKTQDNNFLVACEGDTALHNKFRGFYLVKYNNAGELLWKKEHRFIGSDTLFDIRDLIENSNGEYLALGRYTIFGDTNSYSSSFVVYFDANGEIISFKRYPNIIALNKILQLTDSTYLITGISSNVQGKLFLFNLLDYSMEQIIVNYSLSSSCCSFMSFWFNNSILIRDGNYFINIDLNYDLLSKTYCYGVGILRATLDGIISSGYFGVLKLDQNLDTSLYLSAPSFQATLGPAMECSNGDILVAGRWDYMYWYYPFIWRVSQSGDQVYLRTYPQTGPFEVYDVLEDNDGGIVMLFYNSDYNNELGHDTGLWLYKTNQWGWLVGADEAIIDQKGLWAWYDKNNLVLNLENLPTGAFSAIVYNISGAVVAKYNLEGQTEHGFPVSLAAGYYTVAVLNKSGSILASYKTIIY